MAAPSHYPMSIGRIFSLGWSLFKFAWRPLVGAAAICLVPAYLLSAAASATFSPAVNEWLTAAQIAQLRGADAPPLPDGFDVAVFSLLVVGLIVLLASLLATAALVRVVDQSYRGIKVGSVGAVRYALGRTVALVVANLLYVVGALLIVFIGVTVGATLIAGGGIAVFLGLVAIVGTVAALIFVGMRLSMTAVVVVIEESGGADSLVRSWRVTNGSGWRVLGYLIVIGLIATLLGLLLTLAPVLLLRLSDTVATHLALGTVINGVAAILTAALTPVVLTLLYYDLRWRLGETVPLPGGGETSAAEPAQPPWQQPPYGPPPL